MAEAASDCWTRLTRGRIVNSRYKKDLNILVVEPARLRRGCDVLGEVHKSAPCRGIVSDVCVSASWCAMTSASSATCPVLASISSTASTLCHIPIFVRCSCRRGQCNTIDKCNTTICFLTVSLCHDIIPRTFATCQTRKHLRAREVDLRRYLIVNPLIWNVY